MAVGTKFFQKLTQIARTDPEFRKSKRAAMQWYRAAALKMEKSEGLTRELEQYYTERRGIDRIKSIGNFSPGLIGRMIMFKYKALDTGNKLPYWDALPVVLAIKMMPKVSMKRGGPGKSGAGFLGLNLHYLPPAMRAKFMDAIYWHYKDRHMDEKKRLELSYRFLNTTTRMKFFRPCVKHYLFRQIKGRFNLIHPHEWDMVMMLPIARWQKASESKVWRDSRRRIKNS